jgi:predicted transcriptional regulator
MSQKIKIDDEEYEVAELSDNVKAAISSLKFIDHRITELQNMQALLQRAKNSYVDSLKIEILTDKSGFLFGTD